MTSNAVIEKASVLVVDDESSIRDLVIQILKIKYIVYSAASAGEAARIAREHKPSLALIDIFMPGEGGISLAKRLREDSQTRDIPLIMITAMNARETRVQAFEAGADDFIEKPFHMEELLSRIESKLRRAKESQKSPGAELRAGDLTLDFEAQILSVGRRRFEVGPVEIKMLGTFMRSLGKLVDREQIEKSIWGNDRPTTRSLDTHITMLRKKLAKSVLHLRTVYGEGYILEPKAGGKPFG